MILYNPNMSTTARSHLERVSKTAFGRYHTLTIMMTILNLGDVIINATDLTLQTRIAQSLVRKELEILVELELLEEVPDAQGNRRLFRSRPRSSGWQWAIELAGDNWPIEAGNPS